MQYWVAALVLQSTTWITYRNVLQFAGSDQPLSIPGWMRLPDIPEWMNPRTPASNIVAGAPHYYEESAGYWGAASGSFPVGAALHFYASTSPDSDEMRQLLQLFQSGLGSVSGGFLRSMANTASTVKGKKSHGWLFETC